MDKAAIGVTLRNGDQVHAGEITVKVMKTHKGHVRLVVIAPKDQLIKREHAKRDTVQSESTGEAKDISA